MNLIIIYPPKNAKIWCRVNVLLSMKYVAMDNLQPISLPYLYYEM